MKAWTKGILFLFILVSICKIDVYAEEVSSSSDFISKMGLEFKYEYDDNVESGATITKSEYYYKSDDSSEVVTVISGSGELSGVEFENLVSDEGLVVIDSSSNFTITGEFFGCNNSVKIMGFEYLKFDSSLDLIFYSVDEGYCYNLYNTKPQNGYFELYNNSDYLDLEISSAVKTLSIKSCLGDSIQLLIVK